MCGYLWYKLRQRRAIEGEPLQLHCFPTGVWGFISANHLSPHTTQVAQNRWQTILNWFCFGRARAVHPIYLPAGARLMLREIPQSLQHLLAVDTEEEVVYLPLCSDLKNPGAGIRFRNGWEIPLQHLPAGQQCDVLSLTPTIEGEIQVLREIERIAQASQATV
jgi:nitrogen fixation protein